MRKKTTIFCLVGGELERGLGEMDEQALLPPLGGTMMHGVLVIKTDAGDGNLA